MEYKVPHTGSLTEGGVHRQRDANHWQESRDHQLTPPWPCPNNAVHLTVWDVNSLAG